MTDRERVSQPSPPVGSGGVDLPTADVPGRLRAWNAAIGGIGAAAIGGEPVGVLLAGVAEQVRALLDLQRCVVLLADADGERLTVAASSGLTAESVALLSDDGSPIVHPCGPELDTPAAHAYRERRTVAVRDVLLATRYGHVRRLAAAQGYRAVLAAPLGMAIEPAGVVVGYSVTPREFLPAERDLLELLAGQAALALENARLRSDHQTLLGQLARADDELRRRRAALEWSARPHRALMELAVADVGLTGLAAALARVLRASVTVEDVEAHTLARSPGPDHRAPPDAAIRRAPAMSAALGTQDSGYAVVQVPVGPSGRPGAAAVGHPPTPECGVWMAPVLLGGRLLGRLWVVDPRPSPTAIERRVIEEFALVIGLELLRRRQVADSEARSAGDLIAGLLREDGYDHRAVLDGAAAMGHDLEVAHVVAVLAADPPPSAGRWPDLVRAATGSGRRVLVAPSEDVQVLLVPDDPAARDLLRRAYDGIARALGAGVCVTMVVGPAAAEPGEHAAAYRIAAGAMRLRLTHRPGGFVDVGDSGPTALLLQTGTPVALRRFAERLLAPVVEHEARRGGDLLATLRAWLATGCSTPESAVLLFVHPNTVNYRLARLEQLTGRNLRRPDVRLELQLALTVHDVLGLTE
jgi:GAF domain-containing protein